jgi:hypothetical protein
MYRNPKITQLLLERNNIEFKEENDKYLRGQPSAFFYPETVSSLVSKEKKGEVLC